MNSYTRFQINIWGKKMSYDLIKIKFNQNLMLMHIFLKPGQSIRPLWKAYISPLRIPTSEKTANSEVNPPWLQNNLYLI